MAIRRIDTLTLRFNGSVISNLEVALRHCEHLVRAEVAELSPVELNTLESLRANGGRMHPSKLAVSIGRPATSFTPILDKLEAVGLVERQPDRDDRRAVWVCMTDEGRAILRRSDFNLDDCIRNSVDADDWQGFVRVLTLLQMLNPGTRKQHIVNAVEIWGSIPTVFVDPNGED